MGVSMLNAISKSLEAWIGTRAGDSSQSGPSPGAATQLGTSTDEHFSDEDRSAPGGRGVSDREVAQSDNGYHGEQGAVPSSPVPVGSSPKTVVFGYEILRELGRGGMGVVYQARELRLSRMVALKMILAGDQATPNAVKRLLLEAEIIAQLKHPNIVQVYAIGESDGKPYIALEFIEGGNLESRLEAGPWPARDAARLIKCVALAVAEAHRVGIIHRDLKPANILLTSDGEPKISDFGLARILDRQSRLTESNVIMGSPIYMAPEQAEGQANAIGTHTDIYALGVTLYQLLAGRPPFVGTTAIETLDLVRRSDPVAPRRIRRDLPVDLDTICLKCLEKEPHRRYQSAEALAGDLDAFLSGEPIRGRRTGLWQKPLRSIKRRPAAAALIAAALLVVSSWIAAWRLHAEEVKLQAELARYQSESRRAQADHLVWRARVAIEHDDWDAAEMHLRAAQALLPSGVQFNDVRSSIEALQTLTENNTASHTPRGSARAKFATLQQLPGK